MKPTTSLLTAKLLLTVCILVSANYCLAQSIAADSIKLNYNKIYGPCLNGDIKSALNQLQTGESKKMSEKDMKFKTAFESRFKDSEDKSNFLNERKSPIDSLLKIYKDYWRLSFLDNSKNYDTLLSQNLIKWLKNTYKQITELSLDIGENNLDSCLKNYIQSLGLYTTGFGRTGKYFDLLVWKTKKDTLYSFLLHHKKTSAMVIFMDDFITLGWEEYATLGRYYPGGWATKEALFCVKKAYNLKSEDFLVSYLAHESRHFADYKLFPKLSSTDLEYRAKLTELSMAKETLYNIISFFINNSKYDSNNPHSVANYCVIRDLSKILFKKEFENDIGKWKDLNTTMINETAYKILLLNTKILKKSTKKE